MKLKPYVVINASAGSGKTYTLVQDILLYCFASGNRVDVIKNILALTFTNKAANEMKERLIDWLNAFVKEDYQENRELKNIQNRLKDSLGIRLSLKDLHNKSIKILDYILHHYSVLNIGTIDSFNSKLIRSFSYELGLANQFNLQINQDQYLSEAVDRFLDKIGEDKKISQAFMDLVNYNLDNDEKLDIKKSLNTSLREFINDKNYFQIKKNENFNWESYEKIKKSLREKRQKNKTQAKELAQSALKQMKDLGLTPDDFFGKERSGIISFFVKYINGKAKFPSTIEEEEKKIENYRKGSASKDASVKSKVFSIIDDLIEKRQKILDLEASIYLDNKVLKELLPLKFNKDIKQEFQALQKENDLVFLSEFNILIHENLKNEPSEFIYEKIGAKFNHFFIDEFQDTSKMQWNNMLPLRDNAISQEGDTFTIVGDPKQSIYRFRGGDSEIMLNILEKKEYSNVKAEVLNLEYNWRSGHIIVEFNNELYSFLGQFLDEEHNKLFSKYGIQKSKQSFPGRVKVFTDDSKTFFENSVEKMGEDIERCIELGFDFSDMVILCSTKAEIQRYITALSDKKVWYKGELSDIKIISDRGITLDKSYTLKALIEYLRWEIEPKNKQYLIKCFYYLHQLGRIEVENFTEEVEKIIGANDENFTENLSKILNENYGVNIKKEAISQINLYNYIEFYLKEFSVEGKESEYILNFLESLYDFSQNSSFSIQDFVKYWDEEANQKNIQASENIDAIRVYTIHSSKGLEFPVVFLPINPSDSGRNSEKNWLDIQGFDAIQTISLNKIKKEDGWIFMHNESLFHFNQEIENRKKIDEICKFYVATTRAVEHLYLYLGDKNDIYSFVKNKFPECDSGDSFDFYSSSEQEIKKQNFKSDKKNNKISIKSFLYDHQEKNNIRIATPSKNYQTRDEKIRKGVFLHEILAQIKTEKDVEGVLENYYSQGLISKEYRQEIKNKINSIIKNENYSKYFSEKVNIFSENDILYQGKYYRPDRLIQTDEGWMIIDFKTGQAHQSHQSQILFYKEMMENLGKKVIGTEIIYI